MRDFDRDKYSLVQEAILLNINGEYEAAIERFNQAEDAYGEMIQIYLNRGSAYSSLNQINEAELNFEKCIQLDSTYVPPYLNRGLIYIHSNRIDLGLADFNKAIELDPNEPASYLNRAVAYKKLNKNQLACSDLQKAMTLDMVKKYDDDMVIEMAKSLDCDF